MDAPGALEPTRNGRRGGGGWHGWGASLIVAAAVFAGLFMVALRVLPGPKSQRTWSAADGSAVPVDFLFLMFPVDDHVPLFDAPGGKQVAVLERALGNIYGEVHNATWLHVPATDAAGEAMNVRISDLRYLSPAAAGTMPPLKAGEPPPPNYVGNFALAYRMRKPGEFRSTTYSIHTGMPENVMKEAAGRSEGKFVTLRLQEGGNRRDFHALVTAENAIPLAIDQLYEGSKITASITRWLIAGAVALVGATVAWLGVIALWRGGMTQPAMGERVGRGGRGGDGREPS